MSDAIYEFTPISHHFIRNTFTYPRDLASTYEQPNGRIIELIDALDAQFEEAGGARQTTFTYDIAAYHAALTEAEHAIEVATRHSSPDAMAAISFRIAETRRDFENAGGAAVFNAKLEDLRSHGYLSLGEIADILDEQADKGESHDYGKGLTSEDLEGVTPPTEPWAHCAPEDVKLLQDWFESLSAMADTPRQREMVESLALIAYTEDEVLYRVEEPDGVSYMADGYGTYGAALIRAIAEWIRPENYSADTYPEAMRRASHALRGFPTTG